jgi:hypothetical protein
VHGTVPFLKEAAASGEVNQLRSFEALLGPRDLGPGAGPAQIGKGGTEPLGKAPIEVGMVRDGEDGRRPHERLYLGRIERPARHHLVCDTRERDDLGWNRSAGIAEACEGFVHRDDAAVGGVVERHHSDLDDLVGRGIEARGLEIEEHRAARRRSVRDVVDGRLLEAPENPVSPARLKKGCHPLQFA